MKKPILINSELEFLIVGPVLSKDGVLIMSSDLKAEIIGVANLIYRNGEDLLEDSIFQEFLSDSKIGFMWGRLIGTGAIREAKILLCWVSKGKTISYGFHSKNTLIKDKFSKFIENSYSELMQYSTSSISIDHEQYHEKWTYPILWNISPLLIQCKNPKTKFI